MYIYIYLCVSWLVSWLRVFWYSSVNSVAYLAGGKRIVSGSSDNTIRVWDLQSGLRLEVDPQEASLLVSVLLYCSVGICCLSRRKWPTQVTSIFTPGYRPSMRGTRPSMRGTKLLLKAEKAILIITHIGVIAVYVCICSCMNICAHTMCDFWRARSGAVTQMESDIHIYIYIYSQAASKDGRICVLECTLHDTKQKDIEKRTWTGTRGGKKR